MGVNDILISRKKDRLVKLLKDKYVLKRIIFSVEASTLPEAQEKSKIMKDWYEETGVKLIETWEEHYKIIDI